jgi:DNA-binding transcriptional ArsR family regulator
MASDRTTTAEQTRMAKAMSHPLRVRILEILNERVASPSDISDTLALPVGNVAYHVRKLLELKCVEEVEAVPVRGALEHFYRATRRPMVTPAEAAAMPDNARHSLVGVFASRAIEDFRRALDSAAFDERSAESHLTWTPLPLDEEGFARISALMDECLDRAMAESAASAARLSDGQRGGPAIPARVTFMLYAGAPAE